MKINLSVNDKVQQVEIKPGDTLLKVLREQGYFGVKHGCETGECGACTILLDGKPINACIQLAAQAEGHNIETIEAAGEHPQQGWKLTAGFHPIQDAFVESGAIQCGYCTPAMILAAKELLERVPNPTETEIRDSFSGILCRCTGYLKPVQAVQRAAAVTRGDELESDQDAIPAYPDWLSEENAYQSPYDDRPTEPETGDPDGKQVIAPSRVMPRIQITSETETWQRVGKPEKKVDAVKLAQGKPAFTADFEKRDLLFAKVLHSPYAHAKIKKIDSHKALTLPGVAAVLTWQDIPRVAYSTAGQSDPIPGPLDTFSLDNKVRFVGDRVAFVAAETEDIALKALELIDVEYEPLEPVLDSSQAMLPGAPILHDEPEYVNFAESNPSRNLAAEIRIDIGDVESGFAEADRVYEYEYEVPKVQQAHIEPHIAITYWDEDDRLVILSSTQVPFHARRELAPVLG
ncbi:MAG: 2Fe-2S iron-sulfur cluster-binding protein, partial [Anaerolineales bacterium]